MPKLINLKILCWKDWGAWGCHCFFPPGWDLFIPSDEPISNQNLEQSSFRIR